MKNFRVVIKVIFGIKNTHIDSITINGESLIQAYDKACEILVFFSDNFDYSIIGITEIEV